MLKPLRILLVDDETPTLEVIAIYLESRDHSVISCESGEEALDVLEDHVFDLIISDVQMAGMNGFELLMAPYAVAHMKLGLKLQQTGYDFASDERLRIYLSNTLEEPIERHETLALAGFLSQESNAAARITRQT